MTHRTPPRNLGRFGSSNLSGSIHTSGVNPARPRTLENTTMSTMKTPPPKPPAAPSPANEAKKRSLSGALEAIEKQFGKEAIYRLGGNKHLDVAVIPSGSISLDWALGVGGFPRGRVVEIFGPESSGKTTLALTVVAEAQKIGGWAAYIDAEHALDKDYAAKLGVNVDDLLVSQPDNGEQALEIAEMLIQSGSLDCLVIDSVAALVPRAELEGEMGDSHVGLQARLMSQALRKLTGVVARANTCLIFINQLREKVGVMFGNPETTTGGRALKFYASQRLDIRRIGSIKEGEDVVGNRTKVKVVKNKLAAPFRQVEFDILFNEGISREGDLLDLGLAHKLVQKSGAWLSYGELRLGQGRENARQFFKDNPDLASELDRKLRDMLTLAKKAGAESDSAPQAEGVAEKPGAAPDPGRRRPGANA